MMQIVRNTRSRTKRRGSMNHYCDIWFWRASDQAEVARHLRDRDWPTGEPDTPRRAGLLRSALLSMLRIIGLVQQQVEARPVERKETPVREGCDCGGEEEFQYREAVLDDGEWVLRCPECGHLDRLRWLSEESRALLLGLAWRRWRVQMRRM
jgi:hypothetical protein